MPLSDGAKEEKTFHLGRVFRPSTPITRKDIFSGRISQIEDAVDAINQPGCHAVLYGERGVGKTSLANMLFPTLQSPGHFVLAPLVNASKSDTFDALWRRVFAEIDSLWSKYSIEPDEDVAALVSDLASPNSTIVIDTVKDVLDTLGEEYVVVVVIDEFDIIRSHETRYALSEALKMLSDHDTSATVVFVGVADDIDQLIQDHQSIERCITQIKMPRMSRDEISSIVTTCLSEVGMSIEEGVLKDLARLTRGLPHYAHLLGLHSARRALREDSLVVRDKHLEQGVNQAIDKAVASIQTLYRRATMSSKTNATYREVLLACAIAKTDEFGSFSPKDVERPLTYIRKKKCSVESFARHLHTFTDDERGPALKKEQISGRRHRFRFERPLLQPYVILKSLSEGIIGSRELKTIQEEILSESEFSQSLFEL